MKDTNKQTKKCKIENTRQISVKRKIEKQYDNGKCIKHFQVRNGI